MAELTAFVTNTGVPLVAPVDAPEIEVRRNDTQAIVQAFVAMIDQANGLWTFAFAIPDTAVDYTFQVDGDPNGTGQVTSRERFLGGSFGGDVDLIDSRIDAAISSRNAVTPLAAATDQAEHDATQAAIAAQVVPMDAATSQAEHDNTQVGIGLNLAAIASLDTFIQGGREIDFVGDDAAGWQRVERDVGGAILRRYDLFDELDVRINETVATFIGRQGMISRETISP